jgi:hypothetical protein
MISLKKVATITCEGQDGCCFAEDEKFTRPFFYDNNTDFEEKAAQYFIRLGWKVGTIGSPETLCPYCVQEKRASENE